MPAMRRKKKAQLGLCDDWAEKHRKAAWERACSRLHQYIQHRCWLSDCHREQARSHRVLVVFEGAGYTRIDVPVISAGFSRPSSFSMVGATSASTPPSRTLRSRLPT